MKVKLTVSFFVKKLEVTPGKEPCVTITAWSCGEDQVGETQFAIWPFERRVMVGDAITVTHDLNIILMI